MGGTDSAWVCLVCGYVHHGAEPPDTCPICGASKADFEPYGEPAQMASSSATHWRCLICSYVHEGPTPSGICPICGASKDEFEPLGESKADAASGVDAGKVVILGAGIAGVSAAESIREASPNTPITLISKEEDIPYYRLNLTRYLAGEVDEQDLHIHPEAWYESAGIRLLRGAEAHALEPAHKKVVLEGGGEETFDRLIITCGAHAFVPPIPGASRQGVHVLRTVADANQLLDTAKSGARCIVIGGGILGLEAAGGLARRGAEVTVLEGFGWLLPRQLSEEAGKILASRVEALNVNVRTNAKTREIEGNDRVSRVMLEDGEALPADLVIVATGVRSNSHLGRRAELDVNQGILVDNHLRTSHPDILAAGDVAEHNGIVYGLWEPARFQGSIAGKNAVGIEMAFGGLPRSNTLKVLGIDLFSVGAVMPEDGSYSEVSGEREGAYYRFLLKDARLLGAQFIGDTALSAKAAKAVKNHADFSGLLPPNPGVEQLLDGLQGL